MSDVLNLFYWSNEKNTSRSIFGLHDNNTMYQRTMLCMKLITQTVL